MKFKKFKARKSNKRNGLKKAVNVALIIKIAVSALALLTVLGVVGSVFSGTLSGSSGGGSAPSRPSTPGTAAPETEQTELITPDVPTVEKHYRVNIDYIRAQNNNDDSYYTLLEGKSIIDGAHVVDAESHLVDAGIKIHGWFLVDSGVSVYSAKFVDTYGNTHDLLSFSGVDVFSEAYSNNAAILGLGVDALSGARFNAVLIPFGESVRGLDGDLHIYATTNAGEEILITKITNISVAYP